MSYNFSEFKTRTTAIEEWLKKEFSLLYPGKDSGSNFSDSATRDGGPDWMRPDHIRIAEYFYIEQTKGTLHELSDGSAVWETISPDNVSYILNRSDFEQIQPVKFYILRGSETLSGHLNVSAGVP